MLTIVQLDSSATHAHAQPTSLAGARRRSVIVLLVVLLLASGLLFRLSPLLLWAYNLERAGRLMDTGLMWPEPRSVDALPTARDDVALEAALGHLTAATRWRPEHPAALAQAGEIYAARQAWGQAAEAFETAQDRAPRNLQLNLRTALMYEQLALSVEGAPRETILPDLASAGADVPEQPIRTPFCDGSSVQSCYVGLTTVSLPFANLPEGPEFAIDGLFLHPPARVSLPWSVNAAQPVLGFVLGLDPRARAQGSDGATFVARIDTDAGMGEVVYERTVDAATAADGWVRDDVDLSRWVGQRVRLSLYTTGGPTGNTSADWAVWGELTFTTVEAAAAARLQPTLRMAEEFRSAGLDAAGMLYRGNMADQAQRPEEAQRWRRRAVMLDPSLRDQLTP